MKKMSKGVMIGVIVIILTLGILVLVAAFGFLRGFYPVEHNRIIKNAERYVVDTYGLTPTEVRITTLYLWFPVTLLIETEEDNFSFILRTGRFRYGVRHFIDNYPESMAEYFLIKDLRIYVENATDGQGRVWGSVTGGFILPKLRDIPDIKENISIAIEELHGSYYLGISMNEDTIRSIDDVNIDLMYSIYSHIFELDLHPSRVTFGFRSTNEKNDRTFFHANIRKNDFGNIKLPEDLKPFVEEAIEFYNVVISQLENQRPDKTIDLYGHDIAIRCARKQSCTISRIYGYSEKMSQNTVEYIVTGWDILYPVRHPVFVSPMRYITRADVQVIAR